MKKVAVIMGSDSDLKVVEKAITTLKDYGVSTEVHIFSAHRTPVEAKEFTVSARDNGIGVIIAAAGKAADVPVRPATAGKEGQGTGTGRYHAGSSEKYVRF